MRITKLEHATLVVEEAGRRLVIDPGSFTRPIESLPDVDAVVLTHEHPDHWTPAQLQAVQAANPGVRFFGPEGVAAAAAGFPIEAVHAGETVTAGAFTLRFFGGRHAVIHPSIPVIDNVGVLVNGTLYYPGDSFAVPDVAVEVLATPAGAPWLKIAEVIDFVGDVRPRRSFPTHDAVLSAIGRGLSDQRIQAATEAAGGTYAALNPGDAIEV